MTEGQVERRESQFQAIATVIRDKSRTGQLVSEVELSERLKPDRAAIPEAHEHTASLEVLLGAAVEEHNDLRKMDLHDGSLFYYSSMFMSETYARLLLRKKEGAVLLIAHTVREDSALYPRPTPVEVFREPPFEVSPEELLSSLEQMSGWGEYQDIRQISTSIGRVFLYSTKHLDRDHALMLAEWIDVGQFENP